MGGHASSSWDAARNLLCVRLDALGDVLMTTPAIRALKERPAGRRVTLLTSPAGAGIARLVSEVDEVLVYDAPWVKATPPRNGSAADAAMIERLRAKRFDAAVVFTVYSQNPLPAALACYLAAIPLRLAYCRENPYQLLTDWVREPEPEGIVRHEVRRQLDLVAEVGAAARDERISLAVPPGLEERMRRRLSHLGIDPSGRFVVMHPGATAPSRRYPPELFAEAASELAHAHRCPVVFTGGCDEIALVHAVRRSMTARSWSLAGGLTLEELAALLRMAPVLVSNNSGPVHMAAALGTPVVDIYALTNPQHTPWMTPHRVLFHDVPCRYCYRSVCPLGHQDCVRLVPPSAVVEAAIQLLEGREPLELPSLPAPGARVRAIDTLAAPVPSPETIPTTRADRRFDAPTRLPIVPGAGAAGGGIED